MKKEKDNKNKDRKKWSKEWTLEKQTEGLDKESLKKQKEIEESLKEE